MKLSTSGNDTFPDSGTYWSFLIWGPSGPWLWIQLFPDSGIRWFRTRGPTSPSSLQNLLIPDSRTYWSLPIPNQLSPTQVPTVPDSECNLYSASGTHWSQTVNLFENRRLFYKMINFYQILHHKSFINPRYGFTKEKTSRSLEFVIF